MDRFFSQLFGVTSVIILLQLLLLYFVIKAIKNNIHSSTWIILIGMVLQIIFSLAARIFGYVSAHNGSWTGGYSRTYAIFANLATLGEIVEIVGLCIFFSVIVKRYISQNK